MSHSTAAAWCALLATTAWFATPAGAAPPPDKAPTVSGTIANDAWRQASRSPLQPGEVDRLIATALRAGASRPAPRTSDEQFIRRATLDLTGDLPVPADVNEFVADKDPEKRSKLINRLLETEEYARHWGEYWHNVIASHVEDARGRAFGGAFEKWLAAELKANKNWGAIVRTILTAEGEMRFADPNANGAGYFLAAHPGAEGAIGRAADTSRVFLGIQIQCAQCHDHPSDVWKQTQFHELVAFYARLRDRPILEERRIVGLSLASLPFGEHQMPDKDDPKKGTRVSPRFFAGGQTVGFGGNDRERRRALAAAVTDKGNPWFAAAFVNRVWGELLGQGFTMPVDDMGPKKEVFLPEVLTRLTGAFQGSDYDIRGLFRAIMTTEAYGRQARLGDSADQHLLSAASYPARLNADALWQSLTGVLGDLGTPGFRGGARPPGGPFGARLGFEGQFKEEFRFDPSLKPDEVEGSIPQALLLMNSPVLHSRIQARGTNLLARLLSAYPRDEDALRMLYLNVFARKPTDRERRRCVDYIAQVGNRAEAYEDLLWALLNSTEFQTRR